MEKLRKHFILIAARANNLISSFLLQHHFESVVAKTLSPRHIEIEWFVHDVDEVVHADVRHTEDSDARHLIHSHLRKVENSNPLLDVSV